MNGHADMDTLTQLDCRLGGLRAMLWSLYQNICHDEENLDYAAMIDAILEFACLCDRTLQTYIQEQLQAKQKTHVEREP